MIDRMSFGGLALASVLMLGREWQPAPLLQGPMGAPQAPAADSFLPPAPWLQGDPADSLYRAAREALDRRDWALAADLFAQVPTRFPRSGYAADAYYWRAFALYRSGGTGQLREALHALDTQRTRHPKAATQGDARALSSRIEGELARRGDPDAAARVTQAAERMAVAPTPPTPPSVATPAAPPTPPVPPVPADVY